MADDKNTDDKKKSDDKKKPEAKPLARVCHENERASGGLRRFRIRASNAGRAVGLYVLAPDKDAGVECYLEAEGSLIRVAGFDPKTGKGPNDAKLHIHVDELPD